MLFFYWTFGRNKKSPPDKIRRAFQYDEDILSRYPTYLFPYIRNWSWHLSIAGRLPRLHRAVPSAFLDK